MTRNRVTVLGGAGSGKTTFGVGYVEEVLMGGRCAPEEIAYLSFTKAAASEASKRIAENSAVDPSRFVWFRTIHSLCYRLMREMGIDSEVIGPGDMKRFSQKTGMEGTYENFRWEDTAEVLMNLEGGGRTQWDLCRSAYDFSRLVSRSVEDLDRARLEPAQGAILRFDGKPSKQEYSYFVERYEAFKQREGLIDFVDMLEWPLRNPVPQGRWKRAVLDEVQDQSPLMWAVTNRLFDGNVETLLMIGDENQSIYGFAGVDVNDFIREANRGVKIALTVTHRFGSGIIRFANRIIRRIRRRFEREIVPKEDVPHVIERGRVHEPQVGPALILHRHVAGCQEIARQYIAARLPFRNERGKDPLGSRKRVEAFRVLEDLAEGKPVLCTDIADAFVTMIPSVHTDNSGRKRRLLKHGAKQRLVSRKGKGKLEDLTKEGLVTELGEKAIRERRYDLWKHPEDAEYYAGVLRKGFGFSGRDVPVITTIHGSKGREAPTVMVFSEMGSRCFDGDPDSEHRLAYVAATRTRQRLVICEDNMLEWARERYDYPFVEAEDEVGAG